MLDIVIEIGMVPCLGCCVFCKRECGYVLRENREKCKLYKNNYCSYMVSYSELIKYLTIVLL